MLYNYIRSSIVYTCSCIRLAKDVFFLNDRYEFPVFLFLQFVDAVEMYREVLRSVEEHKDRIRTDDLQQLHAMYNLDEILQSRPEGVQPTLRDGQLKEQV